MEREDHPMMRRELFVAFCDSGGREFADADAAEEDNVEARGIPIQLEELNQ